MPGSYPYELKLPLAPYRFEWRASPRWTRTSTPGTAGRGAVHPRRRHDHGHPGVSGSTVLPLMSDRAEIELIDNAGNPYAPDPISVVRLP